MTGGPDALAKITLDVYTKSFNLVPFKTSAAETLIERRKQAKTCTRTHDYK